MLDLNHALLQFLQSGIDREIFTGGQAAYSIGGFPSVSIAAGTTDLDRRHPVTESTFFDIASVTKLFTATAVLRAFDDGLIALDVPLGAMNITTHPGGIGVAAATVGQLLAHESGLPAWKPFFEIASPADRGTSVARQQILARVLETPLEDPPGTVTRYSDPGFIVLSELLVDRYQLSFARILAQQVMEPLGLSSVHFRDCVMPAPPPGRYAATGVCPWSGAILEGTVHDDNTRAMGGVAGHAGIFARAGDAVKLGRAWLCALHADGILRNTTARRAIERRSGGRGLGVDLKCARGSAAGDTAGPRTFGHLGFTGCSLWMDPDRDAVVALFTNRTRSNTSPCAIAAFRREFHEVFFSSAPPSSAPATSVRREGD